MESLVKLAGALVAVALLSVAGCSAMLTSDPFFGSSIGSSIGETVGGAIAVMLFAVFGLALWGVMSVLGPPGEWAGRRRHSEPPAEQPVVRAVEERMVATVYVADIVDGNGRRHQVSASSVHELQRLVTQLRPGARVALPPADGPSGSPSGGGS